MELPTSTYREDKRRGWKNSSRLWWHSLLRVPYFIIKKEVDILSWYGNKGSDLWGSRGLIQLSTSPAHMLLITMESKTGQSNPLSSFLKVSLGSLGTPSWVRSHRRLLCCLCFPSQHCYLLALCVETVFNCDHAHLQMTDSVSQLKSWFSSWYLIELAGDDATRKAQVRE